MSFVGIFVVFIIYDLSIPFCSHQTFPFMSFFFLRFTRFVCSTSHLVTPSLGYKLGCLQVRSSYMKPIHKIITCFAGTIIEVNRSSQMECSVLKTKTPRRCLRSAYQKKLFRLCSSGLPRNRRGVQVHVSMACRVIGRDRF